MHKWVLWTLSSAPVLSRRQHRQLRSRRHSLVTINDIDHHQRQVMTLTAAAAAAAAPAAAAPAGDDDNDAAAHHPVCHRTPKQNSTYYRRLRRLQEGFQEKSGTYLHCFGLLWDANACDHSDPVYPVLSKRSGTQMTGNQCGRSSYTKISRKTIK